MAKSKKTSKSERPGKALETKMPMRKSKRRRARSNPSFSSAPRHNPPLFTDILEFVLPGTAAFTTTKFIACAASGQIAKRFPKQAKHAGAIGSIGTFAAVWFLGHKWKWLAKYHTPLVVGSAIATIENLIQIYAPAKLAWIVGNPKTVALKEELKQVKEAQAVAVTTAQIAAAQAAAEAPPELPPHLEEVNDDPRWYTYNDAFDAGRYKGSQTAAPVPATTSALPSEEDVDPAGLDEDLAAGIFAGSHLEN